MSATQQESFKELVQSLRSALGVQAIPESGTREGLIVRQDTEQSEPKDNPIDELGGMVQKEMDSIASNVNELIMFNKLGGMVKVSSNNLGVVITISDVVLFNVGETKLTRDGIALMKKIADILKQFKYNIKIIGHTDSAANKASQINSNWEVSVLRACDVIHFLSQQGIDPKFLCAAGYAEYQPIATNDTERGRAQNRRVEVIYERETISNTIREFNMDGFLD